MEKTWRYPLPVHRFRGILRSLMARSGAANEAGGRGGVTRTSFLNTAGWKMAFGGMRQLYV